MIKIEYKQDMSLVEFFPDFDSLAQAFSTIAQLRGCSAMECVLKHYNLYVDGVEFIC